MAILFSSRRRHTRFDCDWSSDVCSSDLSAACPSVVCHQEAVHVPAESRLKSVEVGHIKAPTKSIKSYNGAEGVLAIASSAHPVSGLEPEVLKSFPAFA